MGFAKSVRIPGMVRCRSISLRGTISFSHRYGVPHNFWPCKIFLTNVLSVALLPSLEITRFPHFHVKRLSLI